MKVSLITLTLLFAMTFLLCVHLPKENWGPLADAGNDITVGINDTIYLSGSCSCDEDPIEEYAWKCGDSEWFTVGTGDTTVVAPAVQSSDYKCILRVTDSDGTVAYDTLIVTVETRAPEAVAGKDIIVGLNDDITLTGSKSSDESAIVEYAWKCGDGDWFIVRDGDTTIIAPSTSQIMPCSLRVTDDDGNITYDVKEVTAGLPTVTDIDGNVYTTVRIGSQLWTAQNFRCTRFRDGTDILETYSPGDTIYEPALIRYELNDSADFVNKGLLYNGFAATKENLPPGGWHLPSEKEWDELITYLIENGYENEYTYNLDEYKSNNKIAQSLAVATDWEQYSTFVSFFVPANWDGMKENPENVNRSGFSAYPTGCCYPGQICEFASNLSRFWSSNSSHSYKYNGQCSTVYTSYGLFSDHASLQKTVISICSFYSVRFLKTIE